MMKIISTYGLIFGLCNDAMDMMVSGPFSTQMTPPELEIILSNTLKVNFQ